MFLLKISHILGLGILKVLTVHRKDRQQGNNCACGMCTICSGYQPHSPSPPLSKPVRSDGGGEALGPQEPSTALRHIFQPLSLKVSSTLPRLSLNLAVVTHFQACPGCLYPYSAVALPAPSPKPARRSGTPQTEGTPVPGKRSQPCNPRRDA